MSYNAINKNFIENGCQPKQFSLLKVILFVKYDVVLSYIKLIMLHNAKKVLHNFRTFYVFLGCSSGFWL